MNSDTPVSILIVDPLKGRTQGPINPGGIVEFITQTAATTTLSAAVPANLDRIDVILITSSSQITDEGWKRVEQFIAHGGSCLTFATPHHWDLPNMFGAQPCDTGPQAEIRVLFTQADHPIGRRLPDAFYASGIFLPIDVHHEDANVLLYADWRFKHRPVLTTRSYGSGTAALTTLQDGRNPTFQRIVYRLLCQMAKPAETSKSIGVGLLGYAPSVGLLHASGSAATHGMALRMACDLNPARLDAARESFPDLRLTADAVEMRDDPDIELIIIATPPNTHAKLAELMMQGGKHVICEKPLALNMAQANRLRETAAKHNVHLSCHQNRRWDNDFRMIKNAIDDGLLGDVFHMETFVGGYGHPCGFWHSHDIVSGGTTFDWGAHYLDWMLDLMPGEITGIIGSRQNRLWHDITNADRERIQLRYANGSESEFTHSDLAYIPKPKWYIVGTEGALIGKWKDVSAYEVDPVHYYKKHDIPAAEIGADIIVKRRDARGGLFEQTLPEPERIPFPFHANLADHLLLGEPIEVPLEHSMRVVGVLEAAKRSAENNSAIERVNI